MNPADEVLPPPTDNPTPRPTRTLAAVGPRHAPTVAAVLAWVADSPGPWFPSDHAKRFDVPRDALDDPLAKLRAAGLVTVSDWVRHRGQGFTATPDGMAALADPPRLARLQTESAPGPAASDPDLTLPPDPPAAAADRAGLLDFRPPVVTPVLLFANIAWFVVGLLIAHRAGVTLATFLGSGHHIPLTRTWAVTGADLVRGEWWRLVTCCFVHIGLVHLVVNLFALGMVGPLAELLWGRWRLLTLYLLAGLGGSCFAMADTPDVRLAGASGAIWGVLTSLAAWLLLHRDTLPPGVAADWGRRLTSTFVLSVAISFVPGVSWQAHLGGGVVGFVAAGLLNAVRVGDPVRRRAAVGLLLLMPPAFLAGVKWAMIGRPAWDALRRREAVNAVRREPAPLLDLIAPDPVQAVGVDLTYQLGRPPEERDAGVLEVVRLRLDAMTAQAQAANLWLSGPAPQPDPADGRREAARAFVAARLRTLELLKGMHAAGRLPDAAGWESWKAAKRDADHHWADLQSRR